LVVLGKQKTMLLTTFRRDGRPVDTPVHVAVDSGHAYFRTYDAASKVKRLYQTPVVEIAPSTMRGRPTGPAFRAKVRQVQGETANRAARALARKYPFIHGMLVPWFHRLKGYRTLHFEIVPLDGSAWGRQ
jgi:PPOX class probable F420-dependent enzyme